MKSGFHEKSTEKIANDIRELIGHTPVVRLNHMGFHPEAAVLAKLSSLIRAEA